ncbi:MAG TPA: sel1 repeat family protein [Gammaproteobacteria bacterium]|nr:sel1 repeat family protein [Gammaproteobacteria bacterium]
MDNRRRDRRRVARGLLLFLGFVVGQTGFAFEGDYIWEARFKAGLARAEQTASAKDQYAVADMYFRGRGTAINHARALDWFLRAAKQGYAKAAYKAGYLYLHSKKLPAGALPSKAIPWLKKAAVAGYAPAQYELGKVYFSGKIVKRDESLALKWLGKAKRAGYAPAGEAFARTVKRLVKASAGKSIARRPAASDSVPPPQTASDTPDPKGIILHSQWGSVEGPSRFLPSRLTRCRESPEGIECLSAKQNMQLASSRVEYRTRARMTDFNAEGHFRLTYANNLLASGGQSMQAAIKKGWQGNEQVLDCSLMAGRTISCAQGADRQYQFFGHY